MDFTPAERYGELVEIMTSNVNITTAPEIVAKELEERINELQPQPGDYLILTGNPIVLALTVLFWAEHTSQMNFLQWDRTIKGYKLVSLDLDLPNDS